MDGEERSRHVGESRKEEVHVVSSIPTEGERWGRE